MRFVEIIVNMVKENTIGFTSLVNNINKVATRAFGYQIKDDTGSLTIEEKAFKNYVQPIFTKISHFGEDNTFDEARIILVSAVGATGKTTLAKELSFRLHCPIVDLGNAEVMGGNSLTGIIFKKMEITDGAAFVKELKAGDATMIIDGLDEGFQRTKTQGYLDFLDDVIGMTSTTGKSFILLGRTNAIQLAALHFEDKNVKTITYQIEPFTIEKAYQFISSAMKDEPGVDVFGKPYQELVNYIIVAIGGFFKDHQDLKLNQYERFIGYAPVLLSIIEFLKKNKGNYQRVLSDFQRDQLQGTTLVINIVEGILRRDKEMKILPQLIEVKIKGRTPEFQQLARERAYDIDEQCARVLYRCLRKQYRHPITGDENFDLEYSQSIERWIDEHPFLAECNITNAVFEGYILARLIGNKIYRHDVDEYIRKSKGMSYMFFGIYKELYAGEEYLDLSVVSYLYTSLKALDNKKKYYTLDFTYDEQDADEITEEERKCDLIFEGCEDSGFERYQFKILISKKSCLDLHNLAGDVYIDVPISVAVDSQRITFSAPGYINCKSLDILADEMVLAGRDAEDGFVIEAEEVDLINTDSFPSIVGDAQSKQAFRIVCDNPLAYPLSDYQSSISQRCAKLTATQKEYYKKMRRTLIMFRSHSKGTFAKVKSKIQNRIASKPDGKLVVDALLAKGIIYSKEKLYFIDKNKMNEHLGLKFDGLRTCEMNDKVVAFIQGIK